MTSKMIRIMTATTCLYNTTIDRNSESIWSEGICLCRLMSPEVSSNLIFVVCNN